MDRLNQYIRLLILYQREFFLLVLFSYLFLGVQSLFELVILACLKKN